MKYLVRVNCEYSIEIEAESSDEAVDKAQNIDLVKWDQAWSGVEAEDPNAPEDRDGI